MEDRIAIAACVLWPLGALCSRWVGIWIGIASTAICLGVVTLLLHRTVLARLRPSVPLVGLAALSALVMVPATYLLYPVMGQLVPSIPQLTRSLYATFEGLTGLPRLLVMPLVIISEELVWRGAVLESFSRRMPPAAAAVVAGIVYGAAHLLTGSPLLAALALVCGIYWGLIRVASGSLLVPLLCHLAWDLAVFILVPLAQPA